MGTLTSDALDQVTHQLHSGGFITNFEHIHYLVYRFGIFDVTFENVFVNRAKNEKLSSNLFNGHYKYTKI